MHGVSAAFVKTKISAKMERHAGFEPVLSAWKADVLAIEHQCRKRAFPTYIITPSTSHLLGVCELPCIPSSAGGFQRAFLFFVWQCPRTHISRELPGNWGR